MHLEHEELNLEKLAEIRLDSFYETHPEMTVHDEILTFLVKESILAGQNYAWSEIEMHLDGLLKKEK